MITDAFDDRSPAKINVAKNENAVKAEAVIITFSHVIEEYVTEHYACEKIGEMRMVCGVSPVYRIDWHGKQYGFFRTWVGAPACVAPIEELATVLWVRWKRRQRS